MKRVGLAALLLVTAFLAGCEDSGVSNGRIQGTVLAPKAGFSGAAPAQGVTVQAQRQESPSVLRTTTSDAFGHYQFSDIPTGTYQLSFLGNGFGAGSSSRIVTAFVEPNGVSQVPDTILSASIATGSAAVIVSVVDAVTGSPVSNATVTVGIVSASGGSNGTYSFFVPVSPDSLGQPAAQRIIVNDDAHLTGTETPSTVIPIAGQTVSVSVRVQPQQSTVQGVIQASSFDGLYRQNGNYSKLSISSDQIDPSFLNPQIDPTTGQFSVRVPGSSLSNSIRFSLIFSGQGFFIKTLSGLIAPRAGSTASLSSQVILEPVVTTLEGNVITSSGSLPSGSLDQVSILELGLIVPIVNGQFIFTRVPTTIPLTVRATATNPFRPGAPETGLIRVTTAENGSGRFVVGSIQTR